MIARTAKKPARRILRAVCRLGLLLRSRRLALPDSSPVLVLAPHSDDETLGCGALLADTAAGGSMIHVAYFTDSAGSHRSLPEVDVANLAERRRAEAVQAMKLAGIPEGRLHWLGAPDGRLKDLTPAEQSEWRQTLARLLRGVGPGAILLPCRDDGSSEHEAMFRLLVSALPREQAPRILEFPVWSWWNPRFLWPQLGRADKIWRHPVAGRAALKRSMLACYESQVRALPPATEPSLSPEFLAAFATSHEFFFETKLSP
jgi:LmbE family N-acetylglucosaminyl deacetylase